MRPPSPFLNFEPRLSGALVGSRLVLVVLVGGPTTLYQPPPPCVQHTGFGQYNDPPRWFISTLSDSCLGVCVWDRKLSKLNSPICCLKYTEKSTRVKTGSPNWRKARVLVTKKKKCLNKKSVLFCGIGECR